MAEMSLEQLKEENAKAEAQANAKPQAASDTAAENAAEDELETLTGAESGASGSEPTEVEPWMQSGEEPTDTGGHDPEKQFTHKDIAAAKTKLRAKMEKREQKLADENAELKRQLEAARSGQQSTAAKPVISGKPKAENYETEAEFTQALVKWEVAKERAEADAERKREQQRDQIREHEKLTEAAVDEHYERAAELAEKSKIEPEAYQAADFKVRQMADEVYPGAGDAVIDSMIANIGEGSEKIMFNLGINRKRLAKVKELLTADKSGLKAMAYLGQLKAELNLPGKRRKEPPPPADDVTGDSKSGESFRVLKRKYAEAHKRGDMQTAFNIRREARQKGANVNDW